MTMTPQKSTGVLARIGGIAAGAPIETAMTIAGMITVTIGLCLTGHSAYASNILTILGSGCTSMSAAWLTGRSYAKRLHSGALEDLSTQLILASAKTRSILQSLPRESSALRSETTTTSQLLQAVLAKIESLTERPLTDRLRQFDDTGLAASKFEGAFERAFDSAGRSLVKSSELAQSFAAYVQDAESKGQRIQPAELRTWLASLEKLTDNALDAVSEARAQSPEGERAYSEQDVSCPHCATESSVRIGDQRGDSALGTCEHCGQRFHAHRGSDGLFTKKPGSATWHAQQQEEAPSAPRDEQVICPNTQCGKTLELQLLSDLGASAHLDCDGCNTALSVHRATSGVFARAHPTHDIVCPDCNTRSRARLGANTTGTTQRWCLSCGASLEFNIESGTVSRLPNEPILDLEATPETVISCSCGALPKTLTKRSSETFYTCASCPRLIRKPSSTVNSATVAANQPQSA